MLSFYISSSSSSSSSSSYYYYHYYYISYYNTIRIFRNYLWPPFCFQKYAQDYLHTPPKTCQICTLESHVPARFLSSHCQVAKYARDVCPQWPSTLVQCEGHGCQSTVVWRWFARVGCLQLLYVGPFQAIKDSNRFEPGLFANTTSASRAPATCRVKVLLRSVPIVANVAWQWKGKRIHIDKRMLCTNLCYFVVHWLSRVSSEKLWPSQSLWLFVAVASCGCLWLWLSVAVAGCGCLWLWLTVLAVAAYCCLWPWLHVAVPASVAACGRGVAGCDPKGRVGQARPQRSITSNNPFQDLGSRWDPPKIVLRDQGPLHPSQHQAPLKVLNNKFQ